MQMQHLMVGYPKYYQTADYALRLSVMADIATMRMKALHFWDKHDISAASETFGVSCRTPYWWRQLLNKGGPEGQSRTVRHLWCDEKALASRCAERDSTPQDRAAEPR